MALTKVGPAGIGSTPGTGYTIGDSFLHSTGLEATNANFSGIVTSQSLRVIGDLQVDGTTTTLDTELTSVDKLEVAANNNTVGVAITQSGSGDILNLYDGSTEVFSVADGGDVTITGGFLHIKDDTSPAIRLQDNNNANSDFKIYSPDGDNHLRIYHENTSSDLVTIASGGKVGIGVTNPLETLHVGTSTNDAIRFGNATYGYKLRANISSTDDFGFYIEDKDGNDVYRATSASGTNSAVNTHKFYTSGVERIGITSTGRIEQKSNNEDIDMDEYANGQLKLDGNGYNAALALNAQGLNIYANSANRGIIFGTNETERVRITNTGNVGIGTNNPAVALHVIGDITMEDTSPRLEMHDANAADNISCTGGIELFDSAGNRGAYMGATEGSNFLSFGISSSAGVAPTEKLRINSNGRIAIGTPSDTDHTLCVAGTDDTTSLTGGHSQGIQLQNKSTTNSTYSQIEWRTAGGGRYARIAGIQDDADSNGGQLVFLTESAAGTTTEALRITSEGVLSFKNASPPAWKVDTGYANATFGSSGYLRTDTDVNSNFLSIGSNAYRSESGWKHTNAGWATQLQTTANTGDIAYSVSTTSGSANDSITWYEAIRVTGAGFVGINDSSPGRALSIKYNDNTLYGETVYNPEEGVLKIFNESTTSGCTAGEILFGARNSGTGYASISAISPGSQEVELAFRVMDTATFNEAIRINKSGNVGIGTDNPSRKLDLHESSSSGNFISITNDTTGHGAADGVLIGLQDDESLIVSNKENNHIEFHTNNTERLRITSAGFVGINSTSPYGVFDVRGQHSEDNIFNVWSYDKDSRVSLWPSDDHDADRWRMAFWENSGNSNDYPDWAVDGYGRTWQLNNLYMGRTRQFGDSPVSSYRYYGSTGPGIFIYNGVNGDTTNFCSNMYIKSYQSDTDDRNVIYWRSAGTSSAVNDTSHQYFGVKGTGRVQGRATFYAGRVESDQATPVSAYRAGATGLNAYDSSGEGITRITAYATPSSSNWSIYAETGTSTSNDDVQFKVRATDGRIYSDYGASVTSGADYAESFEWHDGNPDNEDRVGYSVVLQDGKIRKALDSDNTSLIIGIISAAPAVLGDSADLKWQGRYLKDDFGREIMQDVELLVWNHGEFEPQPNINDKFRMKHCDSSCKVSEIEEKLASGEIKQWVVDQNLRIISQERVSNPDYNPSNAYVPRSERPEWDPVGLMGKLWLRPNQPTGDRWVKLRDGDNGLTYWLVR